MSTPYSGASRPAAYRPGPAGGAGAVRRRPSAWWFAVGGLLLIASGAVGAAVLVGAVRALAHTDARFPAEGTYHLSLPAHAHRGLFTDSAPDRPECLAVDGSGRPVVLRAADGTFRYGSWTELATFDTGDGRLTISCRSPGFVGDLRVARVPTLHAVGRVGLLGVAVPLTVGTLGAVVLVVTAALWMAPEQGGPGAARSSS